MTGQPESECVSGFFVGDASDKCFVLKFHYDRKRDKSEIS